MKTKIQWHPAFAAAMDLELIQNRSDLIYEKKYNLNTKPLEIDLLVIKTLQGNLLHRRPDYVPSTDYRHW